MGKPSDRKRSARRPGRRERAQVKKHRRSVVYVSGAGTAPVKLGRKKFAAYLRRELSIMLVSA